MHDTQTDTIRITAPATATAERRTRLRLRELCDEVLASYRLATEQELFTAEDRIAARQLVPILAR